MRRGLLFFRKKQAKSFFPQSLNTAGMLIPLGKFQFARTRIRVSKGGEPNGSARIELTLPGVGQINSCAHCARTSNPKAKAFARLWD
jgi:hypothetical protein